MSDGVDELEHATGDLEIPEGVGVYAGSPDGARRSVAIVVSRFNGDVSSRLLDGALAALEEAGVARQAIDVMTVPGAFELPLAARYCAGSGRYAGVACLGAVIRGETDHYEYVCAEAARGIAQVALDTGLPCAFGVLTVETMAQALERLGPKRHQGEDAARAVLQMAELRRQLRSP